MELASDGGESLTPDPSEVVNQEKISRGQAPSNERHQHKSLEKQPSVATGASAIAVPPLSIPDEQHNAATLGPIIALTPLDHLEEQPSTAAMAPNVTLVTQRSKLRSSKAARKEARVALKAAWFERETCRKQLISNNHWPTHVYEKFETATNQYNTRREELAGLMASGHLNEDDSRFYPKLSVKSTAGPTLTPGK
jgi:hypothetical protein